MDGSGGGLVFGGGLAGRRFSSQGGHDSNGGGLGERRQDVVEAREDKKGIKGDEDAVRIETKGRNLLKDAGSEFVGRQATLNSLEALGIRAYNPDEVERNVVQQLERQMESRGSVRKLSSFMNESDVAKLISVEGSDESVSLKRLEQMTALVERSATNLLRARAAEDDQDHSRADELQIKLQLMRMLVARVRLDAEDQERKALAQKRALAQEKARQDAATRARAQEKRTVSYEQNDFIKDNAATATGKRRGVRDPFGKAKDPFATTGKAAETRKRQRVANALDVSQSVSQTKSASSSDQMAPPPPPPPRASSSPKSAESAAAARKAKQAAAAAKKAKREAKEKKKQEKLEAKKARARARIKEQRANDVGAPSQSKVPREGEAECPLCFRHFPADTIEAHASRCSTRRSSKQAGAFNDEANADDDDENQINDDDLELSASDGSVSSLDSDSDDDDDEGVDNVDNTVSMLDDDDIEVINEGNNDNKGVGPSGRSTPRYVMDDLYDADFENRRLHSKQRNASWAYHWEQAIDQGKSEAEADAYSQEMEDAEVEAEDTAQRGESKYHRLVGGLRLPRRTWSRLFDYQRDAMEWFWDLHRKSTGGILGDEMGLGKTVQMGSFMGSLKCSNIMEPSIVTCPATTIAQWVSELNTWAPQTRIYVLHSSGRAMAEGGLSRARIIALAVKHKAILVTTYQGLRMSRDLLLRRRWGYIILDEGHKVRNPDAEITMVCKQFQTNHRIIMSGSPIQNNLRELWTLVDFVAPGLLGTLPMFERSFSIPINQGGYASANAAQVQAAYQCAKVLKETIDPHLIRRMKKDVAQSLPQKHEQIIFCNLTRVQRDAYKMFLARPEVDELIHSSRESKSRKTTFKLIRALQHICNHPDIYFEKLRQAASLKGKDAWEKVLVDDMDGLGGDGGWIKENPLERLVNRSGKMMVLRIIMRSWFQEGHRVLLFTQGRLMLDILQRFLQLEGYNYLRMDGTTQVSTRAKLINRFNDSREGIFVFLLTTKVGGLGINLTGANRVLIFDPDWNPSTDMQARERAWRIGQKREVTIYRLITGGTIEEKIYHRQIFKQYLSNKILTDARQSRFSKVSNMRDLFTLDESGGLATASEPSKTGKSFSMRKKKRVQQRQDAARSSEEPEELTADEVSASVAAAQRAVNAVGTETSDLFENSWAGGSSSSSSVPGNGNGQGNGDNNILQSLFDHSGFHQAFEHNVVERAAEATPDQRIVAEEAARIAQRAAEALRRDQERTRRDASNVHIPTWTGQSGDAGRFGGSASAELLQRLREQGSASTAAESHIQALLSNTDDPHMMFLRDLLEFLNAGPRPRSTDDILEKFGDHEARPDAELFRQMLRQLADLRNGRWIVKSGFQQQRG